MSLISVIQVFRFLVFGFFWFGLVWFFKCKALESLPWGKICREVFSEARNSLKSYNLLADFPPKFYVLI